jgi:hypothetical protein
MLEHHFNSWSSLQLYHDNTHTYTYIYIYSPSSLANKLSMNVKTRLKMPKNIHTTSENGRRSVLRMDAEYSGCWKIKHDRCVQDSLVYDTTENVWKLLWALYAFHLVNSDCVHDIVKSKDTHKKKLFKFPHINVVGAYSHHPWSLCNVGNNINFYSFTEVSERDKKPNELELEKF